MTVTVKSREVDDDTLLEHTYIFHNVIQINTFNELDYVYIRITNCKGKNSIFRLDLYSVNILRI